MRQISLTLTAVLAVAAAIPDQLPAQILSAEARALGHSALISSIGAMASTRFDGQRVTPALARSVAGNRDLIGWSSCTGRQQPDGTVRFPAPGARRQIGPEVPCLYLVTGEADDFQEYFVLETPCDENASRQQSCLGGYAVDTRVRNQLTSAVRGSALHVTVNRTLFFATRIAQQIPTGGRNTPRSTGNDPMALGMERIGSIRCDLRFTPLTRRSSCQAFNANGNALGEPVVNEGYDYVAYNSSSTGATTCAELGDFAEANALADDATAQEILAWYEAIGTSGGAFVGYLIGRGVGDRVKLGAEGGKAGAVIGGALGYVSVVPSQTAVEYLGPIKASLLGHATEALCNQVGLLDDPTAPPVGTVPMPDPGRDIGVGASSTEGQLCWTCTRVLETTMTVYDRDGNFVEEQTMTVCIEYAWVPCG